MITKAQALRALTFTSTRIYTRSRKPELVNVRNNGRCKTWKTRPDEFQVPVKYGLRECFYITKRNAHEWTCAIKEFVPFDPKWRTKDVMDIAIQFQNWTYPAQRLMTMEQWTANRDQLADACKVLADALYDAGADELRIEEAKAGHLRPDSALIRELLNN